MEPTGSWAKSGMGYCMKCSESLDPDDFHAYDYEGDITCDNCGRDTREDIENG